MATYRYCPNSDCSLGVPDNSGDVVCPRCKTKLPEPRPIFSAESVNQFLRGFANAQLLGGNADVKGFES